MILEILQEKLKQGLFVVEKIITKSTTLPVLNYVLFKTEGNFLSLSATDLETGVKWWGLSKIEKQGKIVIPSRLLSSFINFLPDKKITLKIKDLNLLIETEKNKSQIKGTSSEEFPLFPNLITEETMVFDSFLFCHGLNQIIDIPAVSSSRPEISGIFFQFKKDHLILTATDSFRLGEKKLFYSDFLKEKNIPLDKEYLFILPQKTAREIINIFGEKKRDLKIYFSPNQVMFEILMEETPFPQIQLFSRLIDGEYPNYQEIIPKKFTNQIVLDKKEFLSQVKIASLFSGKISEIKFKINSSKEEVQVFSQSADLGEYHGSLRAKIKGETLLVSFNHRFLIDGLLNIEGNQIIFEINGQDGPAILKSAQDQSYFYVIMPIKSS